MPEKGTALFGIEIECGVAGDVITADQIGGYHSGTLLKDSGGWRVEKDGSLQRDHDFYRMVELISPIFTFRTMESVFAPLKKRLNATDSDMPLRINDSCGAHIHFSWKTPNDKINEMHWEFPERTMDFIRETAFARLKDELPKIYPKFREQYFRNCAKERKAYVSLQNSSGTDRYQEFIFSENGGIEWRSFNLQGVRDWDTMMKMITLGCETLEAGMQEEMHIESEFSVEQAVTKDRHALDLHPETVLLMNRFNEGDYEYHEKH